MYIDLQPALNLCPVPLETVINILFPGMMHPTFIFHAGSPGPFPENTFNHVPWGLPPCLLIWEIKLCINSQGCGMCCFNGRRPYSCVTSFWCCSGTCMTTFLEEMYTELHKTALGMKGLQKQQSIREKLQCRSTFYSASLR